MTHQANISSAPIALPACLDREAARQLQRELLTQLAAGHHPRIDASQVEVLHLSGIQLMMAASQTANVAIFNPSQAFNDDFAALSLDCPVAFADLSAEVAPEEAGNTPSEANARTRVLTIDDSKTMRDMLRLTLDAAGFDVVQAVDGMDGLDVLTRETVDVIITDINMPKMDGYGVIAHLRGDRRYDATPVLVLTTESDTEKKQRARELGATGFIVKPFDPETLVQVIHKVFPRTQN